LHRVQLCDLLDGPDQSIRMAPGVLVPAPEPV
jgi:hypothetical protein